MQALRFPMDRCEDAAETEFMLPSTTRRRTCCGKAVKRAGRTGGNHGRKPKDYERGLSVEGNYSYGVILRNLHRGVCARVVSSSSPNVLHN